MVKCRHNYVTFHGKQETLEEGRYINLYHCLNCGSTITLINNYNSKVIKNKQREEELLTEKY
ncbi:hypothetical protein ACFL40_01890 [candidate division KSB1 bacterium]